MNVREKVMEAMKEADRPASAGEVEKLSGLDREEVDKALWNSKRKSHCVSGSLQMGAGRV